jgi:uncharacterized membrane protein
MLLFSLVTGVFWGTWFSLSRSIAAITPQTFLEIGHTMISNLARPMAILLPAAVLSGIVLCIVLFRRQMYGSVLATIALVLLVVAMLITLLVNVPIDRQIQSWTTNTLPSDWTTIRDQWEFYHSLRTFVSLLALAALFVSMLQAQSPRAVGVARDKLKFSL